MIDPTFAALPHRTLGDAALARAAELGATHADFRFGSVRYQYLAARDGVLQTASDVEDVGFACTRHPSRRPGLRLRCRPHGRRSPACRGDRDRGRRGGRRDDHDACAAGGRAGLRRRHPGLGL
ncbi:hypothetical protein [Nocardioides sp. B-3]|uniref:hypothetical protein n=1 Tax=Nocardioides sp. B-3 TaxID=2895565 RepID=UPI00215352B2|nr:hypothetical protein [Nocardioides sp. B-3]UUZ59061.1 hypothetical protein LP418_24350 [Nocardioides sp. B-3]